MNSLLKKVTSLGPGGGREVQVRDSLLYHLSESIKEVQLEVQDKNADCSLGSTDATNSLCTVVEAIFIHGLKDTFINRVSQVIAGDLDQCPEPSFWGPLLIFSHREIIDQVCGLSQISTDVGKCRAWLRIAINDGLLSSYLHGMQRDTGALRPYYRRLAFLRDQEMMDVSQRMIEGIEGLCFELACNSSLLNTWTNPPLLLAGLWTPPMRSCPVVAGVDVAKSLDATLVPDDPPSSSGSISSLPSSVLSQVIALNEDEALKTILRAPVSDSIASGSDSLSEDHCENSAEASCELVISNGSNRESVCASDPKLDRGKDIPCQGERDVDDGGASSLGNSLVGRFGWSSSFEEVVDDTKDLQKLDQPSSSRTEGCRTQVTRTSSHGKSVRSPGETQSYHSLLESYNLLSGAYIKTPDLRDFFQRFEGSELPEKSPDNDESLAALYGMGFEVVPLSPTSLFDIPEFRSLVEHLGKIARETGLDSQNYMCLGCEHPVGMSFSKARVCSFLGGNFCSECHSGEEWSIPARIIHNWDFRKYPVSSKAAEFLTQIQHEPLLDLKILNPTLYLAVEEMSQLQILRIQLNLLRAYLFTCREPVIEELQKRVWPREYLYEHVHLYSISDLLQIPTGTLAQLLQRVISFAKNHVLKCWLCSQKGFICEICNNSKAIYPFDTESTYRCEICSAVFHVGCLDSSKPCPKCERRKKREDLNLLEVVNL